MDRLSENEIDEFKSVDDVQVVFDVGVRESTDYLELRPDAEFHLFEPSPVAFNALSKKIDNKLNVRLNNYGLGDKDELLSYDPYLQSFSGSRALPNGGGDYLLPIKTLDGYIEENHITRIDFLKIDTEGYDLKVLQGGKKAIELARYIQFETWDNLEDFKLLLGDKWSYKDIGARNIFCARR